MNVNKISSQVNGQISFHALPHKRNTQIFVLADLENNVG